MIKQTIIEKVEELGGIKKIDTLAPNALELVLAKGRALQSYNSIIIIIDNKGQKFLGEDWNFSRTTGKHRGYFMSNSTKKEIEAGIKNGEYIILK